MIIGVHNYHFGKNQSNDMFNNPKIAIGDDLMKPFLVAKEYFREQGHILCGIGSRPFEEFDAFLFLEYPTLPYLLNNYFKDAVKSQKKMYLLLLESEMIRPTNYKRSHHKVFEKVFTRRDDLIDNKKYIKICIPQNIEPENITKVETISSKKLCTLIASYKLDNSKGELYSERIRAIRFFEKEHPEEFDLYGFGRNKASPTYRHTKILLIIPIIKNIVRKYLDIFHTPYFPSWKGPIDNKRSVLKKYTFAICYENIKGSPGYITEKIFDCFFAGCIPIYLGADNIIDFMPENCFVDSRIFNSYQDLYNYIKGMNSKEIENIQKNINSFLSRIDNVFSSQFFSKILYDTIVKNNENS